MLDPIHAAMHPATSRAARIAAQQVWLAKRFTLSPDEHSFIAADGVIHKCHLPRRVEKMILDEQVHSRKENSEAGMRVIPADDPSVGVVSLQHFVNAGPGFGSKG